MIAVGKTKMPIVKLVCKEMMKRIIALTTLASFEPTGMAAHHLTGTMTGMKVVLCRIDKESWDTDGYLVAAINVI